MCVVLWPLWYPMIHLGAVGRLLSFWLPVAAKPYVGKGYGLRRCFQCVVMDTLDMYSPKYDNPQRYGDVVGILKRCGYAGVARTCTGLALEGVRAAATA